MSSAEKALIDRMDNEQGVDLDATKDESCFKKDTKYSWFVCSCTFFSQVFVLGILHAYGVLFVEFVKEFKAPKGKAAWIGSLAYGLSMTFGPVTSILISRYGYRKIMVIGGIICSMSLLASSFANSILLLFFTFSLFYGIGTCMCTSPTMTITSEYFDKYLSVATGITVSGSSFGTLIMSPLTQYIIDVASWRVAFRVYAGLVGITIILNSQIKTQTTQIHRRAKEHNLLSDLQIWKNRVFVIWTFSIALVMFGFYIPYVHLVSYAVDQGISPDRASLLMLVLGATTAVGRIMFGRIVQIGVLNRLHMHQLSMLITGTGVMLLPLIKSYAGIIVYVVTVGLVDGCFVVLLPIMTASLMGIENSVLAWGFMIGTSSITFTLGPPVAGLPIVAGAILLFFIPWAQRTSSNLNMLNDYTVNESNTIDAATGGMYRSDSTGTICTIDHHSRNVVLTKSNITVTTTGTSPINFPVHADKSTSTCDLSSISDFPMSNIADGLSMLSYNDIMFDDRLRQSFESRGPNIRSPSIYIQKDITTQIIPQIPPPSDPVRLRRTEDGRHESRSSSHSGSKGSSRSNYSPSPANQEKTSLSGTQHLSGGVNIAPQSPGSLNQQPPAHPQSINSSADVFLPSASQLFSFSNDTSPSQPIPTHPKSIQIIGSVPKQYSKSVSESKSSVDSDPVLQTQSNFDQTISEHVNMIRETLRSPVPSDNQDKVDESLSLLSTNSDYNSKRSTLCPFIKIQGPTPKSSPSQSGEYPAKPVPDLNEPIAGPSNDTVDYNQVITSITDTRFEDENELTVIPGNNPFAPKQKSQSSGHSQGQKLEDLFKISGEDLENNSASLEKRTEKPNEAETAVKSSSGYEVVGTLSEDIVAPTKAQTSEIDVFKHLFDDDEVQ